MNKEYKPVNNTFREHWKLHNYLSPSMIEELMDKVDDLKQELSECISSLQGADQEAEYWRNKCEHVE
jgi:hypothetical protein